MNSVPFVDSHIHLHELSNNELRKLCKNNYVMLAVSDDISSSFKTIEIAKTCEKTIPAIGVHPWSIRREVSIEPLATIVSSGSVRFLGEVGLDKRFVLETFETQLKIFKEFVELAEIHELGMSIHAPDAWKEVLEVLKKSNVKVAIFHWYTGPINLLKEIVDEGYYIGVNVAAKMQKKHIDVIRATPLESLVTESDGPYRYRGMLLEPSLLPELISLIASIKGLSEYDVKVQVWDNFSKILKSVGISLISIQSF